MSTLAPGLQPPQAHPLRISSNGQVSGKINCEARKSKNTYFSVLTRLLRQETPGNPMISKWISEVECHQCLMSVPSGHLSWNLLQVLSVESERSSQFGASWAKQSCLPDKYSEAGINPAMRRVWASVFRSTWPCQWWWCCSSSWEFCICMDQAFLWGRVAWSLRELMSENQLSGT